ncbi:MAG: L,D-transpeptidase family protein [Lachnospiraceae bacterium]
MASTKKSILPKILLIVFGIGLLLLLGIYFFFSYFYKSHFFGQTSLNGLDVSGLTADEARTTLESDAADYLLTVYDRDGNKYLLKGLDFDYQYISNGDEITLIQAQNSFLWPAEIRRQKELAIDENISYDSSKFNEAVLDLGFFTSMIEPADAYIGSTEDGYRIIPETEGSYLIESNVLDKIKEAVDQGALQVSLTEDDYLHPDVYQDNAELLTTMERLNSYLNAKVTYDLGSETVVVDKEVFSDWITLNDDLTITVDTNEVAGFVQQLASKYNTYADVRTFQTSLGDSIEIGGGDYGWVIDKEAETLLLTEELTNGEIVTREPEYSQTAIQRDGADDIGNTYAEIDYTNQHMYYYEDGVLKLDSEVVTGNVTKGNGSPDGVFKIVYNKSPATLVGEDYSSDVEYFMVFSYNVGFHDASWRSQFGGNLYLTSGSHGCINMPLAKATDLYGMIKKGTPVIAYYRDPVVLSSENASIANAYSYQEIKVEELPTDNPETTPAGN